MGAPLTMDPPAPRRLEKLVGNGHGKVDGLRVAQLVVTILMGVALPYIGWLSLQVVWLGRAVDATGANRFTAQDGAALERAIDTRLDRLELVAASRDGRLDAIVEHDARVAGVMERMLDAIDKIEARLDALENKR
jgi:hypothetical protein